MPTVLVAHGALGSAAQMQPVVDALRAFGGGRIRVEAFEFPGHGVTPLGDVDLFQLTHFVDAMAHAVSALGTPKPLLFGYSMGGYAGLALEARAPGTFSGIVTLGTKFEWTPESAEREALRLDPVMISTKVPKFAALLNERHALVGGWESVVCRTAALLRVNGGSPLLTVEVMERIAVPVCVAVGTKDDTVSVAESRAAADVMLNGRWFTLDDVPHPIERVPVSHIIELVWTLLDTEA
ncbi:MAG: alpha/beta hydrolase [Gemmatimonadaceae bacterium]|nr:alpha/beta hydrolase [Gemmatimonadaceae bacterium]